MIYATLNSIAECGLSEKLETCIQYAKKHVLKEFTLGRHDIDEDIFVNIVSYETKDRRQCFYEAHKAYLDVHVLLQGEEIIDINEIDSMRQEPYQEQGDFLPLFGDKN